MLTQHLATIVAVTIALVYWWKSWRRTRSLGVLAMVRALACLDAALVLGTDFHGGRWLFGIATLPNFLVYVFGVSAAYWLQIFVLHLAHPDTEIASRRKKRRIILFLSYSSLLVFYVLGPLFDPTPAIGSAESGHSFVAPYLMTWQLYIGLAMVDVFWVGRHAAKLPAGWLRLGLRLLRLGGLAGITYAAHKTVYGALVTMDMNAPWADQLHLTVSRALTTVAILLLMAGVTVPAFGPRWRLRRDYRRLTPLWRDIVESVPEVRFQSLGSSGVRLDIADRVRNRLTEIHDALVGPLRPYLDSSVMQSALRRAGEAGSASAEARAVAQAATIAVGLAAQRSAREALEDAEPVAFTAPEMFDYRSEAAWLATVSTAYVRSSIVAEVLKERTRVDR